MYVAGWVTAARAMSRGRPSMARVCSRPKSGRPAASHTTTSPSSSRELTGSERSARSISG